MKNREKHKGIYTSIYLSVFLLLSSSVKAQTSESEIEVPEIEKNMEVMLVTGQAEKNEKVSDVAFELEKFGNSVQVLTSEDIAIGGYTNFAEIAQGLIRGANVGYSPDEGEYTIRLDGGGDRDTLVTMDSVPLYDRGPGIENIWGATLIDSRMIERVEVFRGGQSLYFGSNGGLGVVNVITKRPDGTVKGDAGVVYGSFNTRELYGNYAFPISEDNSHSMMVYGSRYASDGHRIFARESVTDGMAAAGGVGNYANSRDNIGGKYFWDIDATSHLLVNAQYAQIDFQDTFPNNTLYGAVSSRMPLINMEYSNVWSERLKTEVFASYRKPTLYHTKFEPEICRRVEGCLSPRGGNVIIPRGEWLGTVRPLANRGIGDHSIKGGFEEAQMTVLNTVRINESLSTVLGVQSLNYRDNSDPIINIDSDIASTTGVFVDARITPSFSPSTAISLATRVDFADSFGSENIWKFGVRQPLGRGIYARANGGTSFSLPLTNELYSNTETIIGNPDLKPEETETFNAGVGYEGEMGGNRVLFEIGGFQTDITNRIESTTGFTPNTRFNSPRVTEIRGITADMELSLGNNWTTSLSYTKNDATLAGRDQQIDSTPEWFATGTLRWSSDSDTYHFALLPRLQGPETVQAPAGTGLDNLDYGSWFLLNGSVSYWAGKDKRHRTQLRFVNILDETYGERGAFGNQFFGSGYIRGEYTNTSPDYFYPYIFQGKPRSVFLSYSYQF